MTNAENDRKKRKQNKQNRRQKQQQQVYIGCICISRRVMASLGAERPHLIAFLRWRLDDRNYPLIIKIGTSARP